ncbi:putative membrane protein [Rhodanobacter sp. TND4EL1]
MPPLRVKRYLLTGLLTFIPLWVTWLVFKFVLGLLAGIGAPLVAGLLGTLALVAPHTAESLNMEWLTFIVALLITLLALYLLGFVANRVIGQRFLGAFDGLLARIPIVQTIYGGTKKLMAVLQNKPSGMQRVVLIDFPRRGMKVVGFVTRIMVEEGTGREMAAVYIPTTPNPTGGYLELVPVDELTPTDWTMDQAMAFIISGGAVAPDTLPAPRRLPTENP